MLELKDFPGYKFASSELLAALDASFTKNHSKLLAARNTGAELSGEELLAAARALQDFLGQQFFLTPELEQLYVNLTFNSPIIAFKKLFVQTLAKRLLQQAHALPTWSELEAWRQTVVPQIKDQEWATADYALKITDPELKQKMIAWCVKALITQPEMLKNWLSFALPQKIDPSALVPYQVNANGSMSAKSFKFRQGFAHTDHVWGSRQVSLEANYCIVCHPKNGDFCRTGFPVKKGQSELRVNALSELLVGCPLEQHISEMNLLMQEGLPLAALAVAMINNPMLAATGNRICHDCMSACIYQKQTPVDIPNIETKILDMILNLDWGVEIYYLLTQWNPLRKQQWLPKPYNGHKVAVMGLGPAGFTMAYHLLMEGCAIVGLDGQAMTPLPEHWHQPIKHYQDIKQSLPQRSSIGFGGVAEYGITARWDKNLLSIIRLVLARNKHFLEFSSVRFGGNWSLSDAWAQDFSHVVLALGAGLPNVPNIPGSLAPGMRTANDFLMALHLGSGTKDHGHTNLEVRLPAIVIGAGLTAIDTATELQAYYLHMIAQVLIAFEEHYQSSESKFAAQFSKREWQHIQIWLEHARALRQEKQQAIAEQRQPNLVKLLHAWGGVTVVYRKALIDAPAYRENYRELNNALAEGVLFREHLSPVAAELDQDGCIIAMQFANTKADSEAIVLPAASVYTAIGTKLNVAYSFEHKSEIAKESAFSYESFAWQHELIPAKIKHCKDQDSSGLPVFTSVQFRAGVSFIGDTHPAFHGSVVKAMASAKRSYPAIMQRLNATNKTNLGFEDFQAMIQQDFTNYVEAIDTAVDGVWLHVHAPLIAKNWQPGTFCRLWLQGFDPIFLVPVASNGQRLTIYWPNADTEHVLALENQPLQLMGPTGVRYSTKDPDRVRLWFVDQENLATVLAILPKINRSKISLVVHDGPILDPKVIELLSDVNYIMAGVNAEGSIQCMPHEQAYFAHLNSWLGQQEITELSLFTGPALTMAIKQQLSAITSLAANAELFGQAMGPMQCGLKGVCAQCLQWQVDPTTGERTKAVYGCSWQQQPLKLIDLAHTSARAAIKGAFGKI